MSEDRQLGVDLFDGTWRLIESREDDDLMVHMAHASAHHWAAAPECKPETRARSVEIADDEDRELLERDLATI